jgi:hypothetical protein
VQLLNLKFGGGRMQLHCIQPMKKIELQKCVLTGYWLINSCAWTHRLRLSDSPVPIVPPFRSHIVMAASKRRPKVQGAREDEGVRFNHLNCEEDGLKSPSTSPEESGNGLGTRRPEDISAAGKAPSHRGLEIHRYSPTE